MRQREVKVGMRVVHDMTGRELGEVTEKGKAVVKLKKLDGSRGIAAYGEIRPEPKEG
jgi:hypothetical protein